MLQGALAFLRNLSFFLLHTLALYRQIEQSGHSEENYSVSCDILLQGRDDSA
jgi:hypothetical protein